MVSLLILGLIPFYRLLPSFDGLLLSICRVEPPFIEYSPPFYGVLLPFREILPHFYGALLPPPSLFSVKVIETLAYITLIHNTTVATITSVAAQKIPHSYHLSHTLISYFSLFGSYNNLVVALT